MEPDPQYPHNSNHAQPEVTIAYQRDEDLTDCGARIMSLDELDDWETDGVEYSYIFDLEGKWMYFPIGEAENGLHNLKEDLEADTILFADPPFDLDGEDDFGENEDDQDEKIELGGMR
ncbi:hypothetical protein [Anaerotruncus colihominis]|jgi:hypothetical protein|uniref:Uncharacterized protein n=2 Tax=Anaerotruncus colihominis TaxID=169435 RepID=B0P5V7_9FIRM|nr:hypothetical protein [Anaerotruncus colihominis]EDS13114.1 hypothetical protein ANACOL_00129 [Anaerotruncus colihominis DSM 17241]UOX66169.1 hypothetical protein K5I23_02710 [Anaerotruncus colihominis]